LYLLIMKGPVIYISYTDNYTYLIIHQAAITGLKTYTGNENVYSIEKQVIK